MNIKEIEENLFSTKSSDRRKAAKTIGEKKILPLSEQLLLAFLKEQIDTRTWQTQMEMILSLGLIDYKLAFSEIEKIVKLNKPHDMVTYAAAQTYVRLKRKSLFDARPTIELLIYGGLSLV